MKLKTENNKKNQWNKELVVEINKIDKPLASLAKKRESEREREKEREKT